LLSAAQVVLLNRAGNAQPSQSTASQPDEAATHEVVIVYASYVVTRKVSNAMMSKASATGLEVVSASRSVSFSDLDLSQPSDEATLGSHVYQAAHDACKGHR
jgi:UrcA family protein